MESNTNQSKSVFITGANGGLGLETVKWLIRENFAEVIMACRTDEKAKNARNILLNDHTLSGDTILTTAGGFDMNNPEAIENAVDNLTAIQPYDILFFQVGGIFVGNDYQYVNYKGNRIEKTVFQNVIGSYITLVNLMKKGLAAPTARIIFAGGEGARGIPGMIKKPTFNSPKAFKGYLDGTGILSKYSAMDAIGVSKLSSALMVQKLASLNDDRTYVWFTPGLTHGTNGLSEMPAVKRFIMEKIMFGISGLLGFSQSPSKGARKYADAIKGKYGKNGEVLGAPEGKVIGKITDQKPMNSSLTDQALIDTFWEVLVEVYEPYQTTAETRRLKLA